ncbi:MAG: sigma-70 family RNA polymerase sigma factor [Planctomycetota bacterium]|jgi:RNA polymerase sigma-70 factor (ECF subfamily)|nr:sigma-70 family RNA polymerase sigma factor [Planctomycetota bacterium]
MNRPAAVAAIPGIECGLFEKPDWMGIMNRILDSDTIDDMPHASVKRDRGDGAKLLARIAKGDEKALEEFYEIYFSRLYRFVFYRVGRDHHHAEEVIHDTFMEAVEKADQYNPSRGSVESWLITLSRNRIRSNNALMTRPHEYEKSWSMVDGELENLFADMDKGNMPESALESEYLRDLVGSVMGSIPQDYSKLLEMKYISNLSVRDISKSVHKTEKAVESQLTRARIAFRDAFKGMAQVPAAELGF